MSEVTEKWEHSKGQLMSREEAIDRLAEFQNMDLDDFYTDGEIDYDKIAEKGLTHFIKSATFGEDGKIIECRLYNDYAGYIYLITSEVGPTKIGKAEDVQKRFSSIDGSSPCRVKLYHYQFVKNTSKLERLLHQHFKAKRVKGEWFNLTADEIQQAKEMIDSYEWQKKKRN